MENPCCSCKANRQALQRRVDTADPLYKTCQQGLLSCCERLLQWDEVTDTAITVLGQADADAGAGAAQALHAGYDYGVAVSALFRGAINSGLAGGT